MARTIQTPGVKKQDTPQVDQSNGTQAADAQTPGVKKQDTPQVDQSAEIESLKQELAAKTQLIEELKQSTAVGQAATATPNGYKPLVLTEHGWAAAE